MFRFLHTADLHLKSGDEENYSFGVFQEILDLGKRHECHAILFCGDTFDQAQEISNFLDRFEGALRDFPIPIYLLHGNHELLRKTPAMQDPLSPINSCYKADNGIAKHLTLTSPDGEKVLLSLFPFVPTIPEEYYKSIPSDEFDFRIAMAHGTEKRMVSYTGPSQEEENSLVSAQLVANLGYNYLALGHIHARRTEEFGSLIAHYPGSPRVVSAGEIGTRNATLVTLSIGEKIQIQDLPIQSSGEFREIQIVVLPSNFQPIAESILQSIHPNDYVRLYGIGIFPASQGEEEAKNFYQSLLNCRKFEFKNKGIFDYNTLRSNALVQEFFDKVSHRRNQNLDPNINWDMVVQVGLQSLTGANL